MSLIMGQVIPDQSVLSALEIEKLNLGSLFGIYLLCSPVLLSTQVSDIGPLWSSCLYYCGHFTYPYQTEVLITRFPQNSLSKPLTKAY